MLKKTKMRVPIPRNPEQVLELATKVFEKHEKEGTKSPLNGIEDYNWEITGPEITKAIQFHDEAEKLKKLMEKAYKERDLLIQRIDPAIKASRDVLTGIYRQNMKRMGEWGFIVNDSPRVTSSLKKKKGKDNSIE